MSQSRFDQLLQKYLAGECTPEEEKIVLEWYEELIRNSELHLSDNEKTVIESRLWEAIQSKTQPDDKSHQPATPIRSMKRYAGWKIAAAACILALVLAGIFLFRQQQSATFTAGATQKEGFKIVRNETTIEKKLILSDSTQITLQPGAVIEYPEQFNGNTREVLLTGNAFFNVHHNPAKHFKVNLGGVLTTEVLGTSFHIIQDSVDSSIEVAVVTGKVHVFQQQQQKSNDQDTKGVILTRNKKVIFNITTSRFITALVADPRPLSTANIPAPAGNDEQHRPFNFEDEPLHAVLESLSKAYGISITTESEKLSLYHFTGNISKYDLYKQLDIICQSTQSVYEIKGDQITIKEQR